MKIFLACLDNMFGGIRADKRDISIVASIKFVLESFFEVKQWQIYYIKNCWMDFLLDSGAFAFLNNTAKMNTSEIDNYVKRYIDFINKHDIKKFFEMDIDPVVGLKEVERYRDLIERETGKRSIPVWHKTRGKQYFLDLVKEYDYVSIGGIVTREIKPAEHKFFPWFISKAHENNCKIHGLGYTSTTGLFKYDFDSVDSTSWTAGRRFGHIFKFENGQMKEHKSPKNFRVGDYIKADYSNLCEWIKFQDFMCKRGLNLVEN